jgi:hypothetical protein
MALGGVEKQGDDGIRGGQRKKLVQGPNGIDANAYQYPDQVFAIHLPGNEYEKSKKTVHEISNKKRTWYDA